MKMLSRSTREQTIKLLKEEKSCREIANKIQCSKSTIGNIQKTLTDIGSGGEEGGRSKFSPRDKREIVRNMTSGILKTPKQAATVLRESTGISISTQTIRNVLRESGLKARKKAKKLALTIRHKKARLQFALRYKEWTVEDWKNVIWSDETKINRIISDGILYTWQKDNEDGNTIPTVKFGGGNLMLWGCMAWFGQGLIVQVIGKMTAKQYISILDENLMRSMEATCLLGDMPLVDQLIFQQHNDLKHTARATVTYLDSKAIKRLEWPAQSVGNLGKLA